MTHDLAELDALRRNVDRWFLVAVAATAILAAALATSVASRVSRPLVELSEKTARVDLDRLDVDFDTSRNDEIGSLARVLGAMTARLRESAAQVKDAERRATLGELARQVNHDIRNGLTPLRNVFRHLAEVARDEPQRLEGVFEERRGTLDSSISYLETLASNYARFARFGRASAPGERRACDVNEIVRRVVADRHRPGQAADLRFALCERAVVLGDPVSLRRIFENLVDNAVDSLESRPGRVEVSTSAGPGEDGRPLVRITVLDTGVGMSEGEQGRAFDDFYTTKPGGTGLGLSIVRRLVMDHDGAIRVESAPGAGSRFVVELPGAGAA